MEENTQGEARQSPKQSGQDQPWEKQLQECQTKAENYLNSWKRVAADFENYKKRRVKEDEELLIFVKELTLLKLLPSLEALEQAVHHLPAWGRGAAHQGAEGSKPEPNDLDKQWANWLAGFEGVVSQFDKALAELGVERIKTVGEKYNHALHEAVEMTESQQPSGQVVEEVAPGYKIHDKVVRPAKVKVAK